MLVWWIIGALIALGPAILSWIKVFEYFKGKSLDVTNFVTRSELTVMKQERDAQIATTIAEIRNDFDRLEKFMTDLSRDLPAIHRALGRLEGHDDAENKRRPR